MNFKKIFLLTSFLLFFLPSKSQEVFLPKHTIILEAGGIGGFGSLNYERIFFSKEKYHLSYRAGFSFFRFKDFERTFNPDLLFPISIHFVKKIKNHALTFGGGLTISSIVKASSDFSSKIRRTSLSPNFITGYRFQKANKPFSFQINYTPVFQQGKRFRHWGNIGFGYSFFQKK